MGFYSAKVALESSAVKPEDVINTPNDIGNELKEIEDAIAGPDGLEANREEVEAAQTGLIGDPVDEAYMSLFESEYNFNQIMRTIGIHELAAAQRGRDFVLEAADRDGLFSRIIDWLKKQFENVVKAFKYVIAKIGSEIVNDKKFVTKHEKAIREGFYTDGWSAEGYSFTKDMAFNPSKAHDFAATCRNNIATAGQNKSMDDIAGKISFEKKKVLKDMGIEDAGENPSVAEVKSAIYAKLRGEKKTLNKQNVDLEADIIKVLKSDNDRKQIKESYENVKKSYQEQIEEVKKIRDEVAKKDNKDDLDKAMAICSFYFNLVQFQDNAQYTIYRAYLDCTRGRRAQARKLAAKLISVAPKAAKVEVQNNSANVGGGIFANLPIY